MLRSFLEKPTSGHGFSAAVTPIIDVCDPRASHLPPNSTNMGQAPPALPEPRASAEADETAEALQVHFDLVDVRPEDRRRRWKSMGISSGLQWGIVAGMVWFSATHPRQVLRPKHEPLFFQVAVAPPVQKAPRFRMPKPLAALKPRLQIPVWKQPAKLPEPPQLVHKVSPKLPELPVMATAFPRPPAAFESAPLGSGVPKPHVQPAVRTDVFDGSSAAPTLRRPVNQVQTGGFGSPNGFRGEAKGGSLGNVARLGSFDLPSGPGYGNGSGGSRGARGTVASAGFGDGSATAGGGVGDQGSGRSGTRGKVSEGGFGDETVASTPARARASVPASSTTPVEILSKPTPAYTEEARRLHVEGEVLVAVILGASGQVRVLRVVRGLGHGLDEVAMQAAQRIEFKPARRGGEPVDAEATVHIIFQLAE